MVKVNITSIDEDGVRHHLFFLDLPAVPRVKETLGLYGPFGDGQDGEALLEVFDVSYEALVNRSNSNTEFGTVADAPIVYVRNIDGTPFRLPCTCHDVSPANGDVRGFEERELGQGAVLFVCDHCGSYLTRKTRERLVSARFTAAVDAQRASAQRANTSSAKPSEPAVLERIAAQNAHAVVELENSKPLSAEAEKEVARDQTYETKRIGIIHEGIRRCILFLHALQVRGQNLIDPRRPLHDQQFEYLLQPEARAAEWELVALRWELAALMERERCAKALETAKREIADGPYVARGAEGRGVVHNAAAHIRNLPSPTFLKDTPSPAKPAAPPEGKLVEKIEDKPPFEISLGDTIKKNDLPFEFAVRPGEFGDVVEMRVHPVKPNADAEQVLLRNDTPTEKAVTGQGFFRANAGRVERIPEFFGSTTATNPALARAEIGAAYANRDYPSDADMLKEAEEYAFDTILRRSKPNSPLPPHVALRLTPIDGQRFAYQFKDSFVLTGLALQVKGAGADVADAEIDLYKSISPPLCKRHNIAIGPLKRMVDEELRLLRLAGVSDCVDIGSIVEGERRAAFADLRGAKNPMLLVRLEEWNERGTPDRCYFSTGDCVFLEFNNGPSNLVTPFALGFHHRSGQ